jgi:hypothetical protein
MTRRPAGASAVAGTGVRSRARPRPTAARPHWSWKKRIKTIFALGFLLVETAVAVALVGALVIFWQFSQELPGVEFAGEDIRTANCSASSMWSTASPSRWTKSPCR